MMLMRNTRYPYPVERELDHSVLNYSQREMLLGQIVLLLLFVIAIILRAFSG